MAADDFVVLRPGARVGGRWTIIKKLGAGAFGAVYQCRDERTGTIAALKAEPLDVERPLLFMEATVLMHLKRLSARDGQHFCHYLDLGRDNKPHADTGIMMEFNYVVMSLAGQTLDKLFRQLGDRFSPGTAIGLSIQMLKAIKALHSVGYLHRDIKPANSAIGRPETNEQRLLYLIDFGMARRYIDDEGQQRRPRDTAHFRGTPVYAPISAHIKREYSRRDDVESWFYVLVKFFKGALPWKNMDKKEIGEMKCRRMPDKPEEVRRQAVADLLRGCPAEFREILTHIDSLELEDRPNYRLIETLLRDVLTSNRIQEHPYDWEAGGRNAEQGRAPTDGGDANGRAAEGGRGE